MSAPRTFNVEETRALNKAFCDRVEAGGEFKKEAAEAIEDYTRMILREEGFMSYYLPAKKINREDLDTQIGENRPVKICSREPFSPAAMSIPLNTLPRNFYIRDMKYMVLFDRIVTPRATVDVATLYGAQIDLRQIISDNMLKDIMFEEDRKFIGTCNALMVSSGTTLATSGVAQWRDVWGGISREAVTESPKVLRSSVANLSAVRCLVNHLTICDIAKWDYIEAGGDMSGEMLIDGFTKKKFLEMEWWSTIKKSMVPTNSQFLFADEKFLGKHFFLEDVTLGVDRKYFNVELFAYKYSGAAIANTAAIGRVDYKGG